MLKWLGIINLYTKFLFMRYGGGIPFVNYLGKNYPDTYFLVTGASLPDCSEYGPNENLDLATLINLTSALVVLFSRY